MTEKKRPKDTGKNADRHKPSRQVRVKQRLIELLDQLAERNLTSAPDEANRAIRELLEREGLWPARDAGKK